MQLTRIFATTLLLLSFFSGNARQKEVISYDLKFGVMKAGEAKLVITDTTFNGKRAVHYYLEGQTTGLTDKLFKVYDIYESTVDPSTMLPYRAVRNIRERKYRYYDEVLFFQDQDSIFSQRNGGKKVPNDLTDFLSVFFYFVKNNYIRTVAQGESVVFPTLNGDNIQDIRIQYKGVETIDTHIGKSECYVLAPVMDKGKLMKRSDGLLFYISRKEKIPVLFDFDMRVGALRALITSYKVNGKEQLWKR
ncbi:MAG TPA: DUF3108 domain-containing protein [Prolixibacteraceae bacterium]|nr:DUF3108 domain-containing protein [Prolixibacteraceae bacterium]